MEGAGVKEAEVVGVALAGLTTSVDGTVWGTDWEMVCILVPLLTGDSKFKTLPFFRGVEDRTEDSWLIISVSCSGLLSLASRFWILARKQITGTIKVSKFRNCCINVVAQVPPSVRDPRPTEPPVFRQEKLVSTLGDLVPKGWIFILQYVADGVLGTQKKHWILHYRIP